MSLAWLGITLSQGSIDSIHHRISQPLLWQSLHKKCLTIGTVCLNIEVIETVCVHGHTWSPIQQEIVTITALCDRFCRSHNRDSRIIGYRQKRTFIKQLNITRWRIMLVASPWWFMLCIIVIWDSHIWWYDILDIFYRDQSWTKDQDRFSEDFDHGRLYSSFTWPCIQNIGNTSS